VRFAAIPGTAQQAGVLTYLAVLLTRSADGIPQGRGCITVAEVKIQEGESIESALRRFKRKVQQEDIIKDIKKHSFYLKPGDKRRAKQALARKRSRKKQRREVE
jgi:small subunit ribosomal protein S21